jgi:hypothetical protein
MSIPLFFSTPFPFAFRAYASAVSKCAQNRSHVYAARTVSVIVRDLKQTCNALNKFHYKSRNENSFQHFSS